MRLVLQRWENVRRTVIQAHVLALIALLISMSSLLPKATAPCPSMPSVVGEVQTHTVVPGDGLYVLARGQGLAYPAIARANGIADPNIIWAGAVLVLPTCFILPALRENGVVVNIPEYRLYVFREGMLRAVYPVAVGLPTWRTPVGYFTVINKVQNPAWYMPAELARREKVKREVIPPGPDNPLGDFWIGTSLRHTGIHSTNCPMSVGRPLSHGCVRLYPEHVKALFQEVTIGEIGEILYQPVKMAVDGDEVLVEIHPDVYGVVPDLAQAAEERLRAMGVWGKVDTDRLREAVVEARGIPVAVQNK